MNNVAQNKTEPCPFASLLHAVTAFAKQKIELVDVIANDKGDMEFGVRLKDVGIQDEMEFIATPFHRSETFWNFIAEILVRSRLDHLLDVVMGKDYEGMVKGYVHKNFGMRLNHDKRLMVFQFHASLLHRLFNENLSFALHTYANESICAHQERIAPNELPPKIVSWATNDNLRIKIPRMNGSKRNWEVAINAILDYYGVQKRISISRTEFSYQMDINEKQ